MILNLFAMKKGGVFGPAFFMCSEVLGSKVLGSEVLGSEVPQLNALHLFSTKNLTGQAKVQSWKVHWLIKLIGLNEFNLAGSSSTKPQLNKKNGLTPVR